jgi:hypothetical protein
LDNLEHDIKEKQTALHKKEHEKSEDNKKSVEELKKSLGGLKDTYKQSLREVKNSIGTELYSRFMKGFVRTKDSAEQNEKIAHSEFLFKKLKF